MLITKWTSKLLHSTGGALTSRLLRKHSKPNVAFRHYTSETAPKAPTCSALQDIRSVIKLKGEDCYPFLQGLITNDVYELEESDNGVGCIYGMILNNKGRIAHDILLYKTDQNDDNSSVLLECDRKSKSNIIKLLKMYKLRKKVQISPEDDVQVFQLLAPDVEDIEEVKSLIQPDYAATTSVFRDPRLADLGYRCLAVTANPFSNNIDISSPVDYHRKRYDFGIPEGIDEIKSGKLLPLETNIDFMNGVSFNKGCYIGQELTARTYHTGVIRKRLVPCALSSAECAEDDRLFVSIEGTAKPKRVGKIVSVLEDKALALMNIEFLSQDIFTKAGSKVDCSKPAWWPCSGDNPHSFS